MADLKMYDDGEEAPVPQPREAVRFTSIAAQPYPDGRRMKLNFQLTPFQDRPSVDVTVTNAAGQEVASLSLIEAMDTEFDFTVHLRGPEPRGEHTLRLVLFYLENDEAGAARQVVDERAINFHPLPEPGP